MTETDMPANDEAAADPTKLTADLVRQGERTVDNLKRLFAVVFALSFGIAGNGAYTKLKPVLLSGNSPPGWLWVLNIEMMAVFLVTAAVFYHQSVKFLDIRYAKTPLSEAHPWGFAADYIQLVLTAAPFFLMANSLGHEVTNKVGYVWYFASYVVLLGFGLVLLVISEVRHSRFIRHGIWGERIAPEEIERESLLRAYWMVMNGTILMILLFGFWYSSSRTCSAHPRFVADAWFLYAFGIVALIRDYLDFRWAWPFLYPIADPASQVLAPLTWMATPRRRSLCITLGVLIVLLDGWMLYTLKLWDFAHWSAYCS